MDTTDRARTSICSCANGTDHYLNVWCDLGKPLTLPTHETFAALEALLDAEWIELYPANATPFRLTTQGQRSCEARRTREAAQRATA